MSLGNLDYLYGGTSYQVYCFIDNGSGVISEGATSTFQTAANAEAYTVDLTIKSSISDS